MSQKVVVSEETAREEVQKLLQRNGYKLICKFDKETLQKFKKRHSRGIDLVIASDCIYVKFGNLGSGKLDTVLCATCMIQQHRGGMFCFL